MDEFPNISGFNYRIGRHGVGDDAYYRIHECFYDENAHVVLWGEASPHGESAEALIADLEQMLADARRSRDDIFDVPAHGQQIEVSKMPEAEFSSKLAARKQRNYVKFRRGHSST